MAKRKTAKPDNPEMDNVPRVTVTLTDEACWITRHDRTGAPTLTYPATITDVCNAFNRFGASTGLLPADTLFWTERAGVLRIGVWLPPARRTIHLHVKADPEKLRVPLPGLMFVGQGTNYSVYALTERPITGNEMLYHAPLPNVHENGLICAGSVQFPLASGATLAQAVQLFFESLFNHDLSGGKVRKGELLPTLRKLKRASVFPSDQLVATGVTVNELITGERGQGAVATDGLWVTDDAAPDDFEEIDPYELAYTGRAGDDDDD